jgi:non-ribosomal peptide synthase protein (TIGR01720 family)
LSELKNNQKILAYKKYSECLHKSLNLSSKLLQVALFKFGNHQVDRLLFIIHHLAVDGVSWRILLEYFALIYKQLSHKEEVQLPPKTTSYQDWSTCLIDYSQSEKISSDLNYWVTQSQTKNHSIPVNFSGKTYNNTISSTAKISILLDQNETHTLLKEIPKQLNSQIHDILLTVLVQSFAQWTGFRSLLIDLEGHGREEQLFENINISRTVGWFSAIFPVMLELEKTSDIGDHLKSIKEQLRCIPNYGISYGILRYLSPDKTVKLQFKATPKAEVVFNYLGQINPIKSDFFTLDLSESSQFNRSPDQVRRYLLEINGFVSQNQLQLNWIYSQNIHKRETIEYWASHFITAIKALIAYASSPKAEAYTPSDFSAARINQKQLDKFITKLKKSN